MTTEVSNFPSLFNRHISGNKYIYFILFISDLIIRLSLKIILFGDHTLPIVSRRTIINYRRICQILIKTS